MAQKGGTCDAWPPHAQQLGTRRQHRRLVITDHILGLASKVDDLADDLGNPSSARVRVRGTAPKALISASMPAILASC